MIKIDGHLKSMILSDDQEMLDLAKVIVEKELSFEVVTEGGEYTVTFPPHAAFIIFKFLRQELVKLDILEKA